MLYFLLLYPCWVIYQILLTILCFQPQIQAHCSTSTNLQSPLQLVPATRVILLGQKLVNGFYSRCYWLSTMWGKLYILRVAYKFTGDLELASKLRHLLLCRPSLLFSSTLAPALSHRLSLLWGLYIGSSVLPELSYSLCCVLHFLPVWFMCPFRVLTSATTKNCPFPLHWFSPQHLSLHYRFIVLILLEYMLHEDKNYLLC